MRKIEVSLVAGLIIIVILATSTVWFYELNAWRENQNENLRRQIGTLQSAKNSLLVQVDNLEGNIDELQEEILDLEIQVDSAYDEGYVQGVTDGAGRGFNIRDPAYQEALQFIELDQTDKNEYSETYTCFEFTADFEKNAFEVGYRCGLVYIELPDSAHSIACFNTTDQGLIFIEPQDDEIVTLKIGQPYWDRTIYEPPDYDDTVVRFVVIW